MIHRFMSICLWDMFVAFMHKKEHLFLAGAPGVYAIPAKLSNSSTGIGLAK